MTGYRERCLSEKPEECVICGVEDDLEVHHKDGNPENNSLENLIPLCSDHHTAVHNYESPSQELNQAIKQTDRSTSQSPVELPRVVVQWGLEHSDYLRSINTRSDSLRITLPQEARNLGSEPLNTALFVPKSAEPPDEFPEPDFEVFIA